MAAFWNSPIGHSSLCVFSTRLFSISETSGQIRTLKGLNYEAAKSHTLLVTARDLGVASRSSLLNITINVEDIEDVIPVFPTNLYTASVPENARDYEVVTVQVCEDLRLPLGTPLCMPGPWWQHSFCPVPCWSKLCILNKR